MKVSRFNPREMRGFTLIELLVVISIIAILATIGAVAGARVITTTKNLEAKTTMKGLECAIKGYNTQYLRMPRAEATAPSEDNQALDTTDENGRAFLDVLLAMDPPHNPLGKRFWESPPARSNGSGYSIAHGLRDPWGKNGYRIIMDYSGDGRIDNPYAGEGEAPVLSTDVIIYCAGANGTFETGGSTGGKKPDDLKSWQQ